ncbi:MAG: S8 family serine peptidase, partial [Pseudomonadota bacterium]|nr:S8 family serine peptidase [Pseudomonadota bacterium]
MKIQLPRSLSLCVSAAVGLTLGGAASSGTPLPTEASPGAVIVILRDQVSAMPPVRHSLGARAEAIAQSQASVISQLQAARPRPVTAFRTINAFATAVTPAEAAQLASHPMVQAVVPDRLIRQSRRPDRGGAEVSSAAATAAITSGLCGTLEPEALQLTRAAFADLSTPQAQTVLDGHGQPVTGKGVKVAFLADGLDPNIAGFIRPDGSHVFIDYQDFSGDPAGTPTAGGEAFGDASSIAAQDDPKGKLLSFDIGRFVNPAHPLPKNCEIRIRGMAPGASLVGLKVFSNLGYTTTSTFIQAIEYAVVHDDVDVINESFGGNPYPDTTNDPISMADAAAVKAGVTVTVSTGDAGTAGTLGSPGTDASVIAAGASTQFRLYAQTGYGSQALARGYLSNNISALSSGGFAQSSPRTVDVVAPGDLGWALCSTNTALYVDCTNNATPGAPAPIEAFGGTSESAPLVAGEAALVIQAYRSTHGGADPSPALVKQIIMSTATDLGAPSSEQGAGLINALDAVRAALSVADARGRPTSRGPGLLIDASAASVVGTPNERESQTFRITNTGSTPRHLSAALQTLGEPIAGATLNLQLAPASDPTYLNVTGSPRSYIEQKFVVPAGMQHLDAAVAYQVSVRKSTKPIVYLALLDPNGRQAAYTLPQGLASGYGHVDVVMPAAGTWTAVIATRPSGAASYAGPVQLTWAAEKFVALGTVYPRELVLAPGATQAVTADFFMPSQPGDLAAALRFSGAAQDGNIPLPEVPVSLRTLIPVGPTGGSFTGTLSGGNGRPGAGPTQTFEFDVPKGINDITLVAEVADNGYLLEGLLVDPNGMQLSVAANADLSGNPQFGLQLSHYDPQPGRWKFVLVQNYTSSGNQTSLPFTARIGFNTALVTARGLPNNAKTKLFVSRAPVTATIDVTNNGPVTQAYFADARLRAYGSTPLAQQTCSAGATLPGTCALFFVPTQSSRVQFQAKSTVPFEMDAFNSAGSGVGGTGSPDIL